MSKQTQPPVQRWGRLEDSYEPDLEPQNNLNLLTENMNLHKNKLVIYAGLQFDEEKKTLSEKAGEVLAKVGNVVASAASDQVTKAKNADYAGMFGVLKNASKFIVGKVSDLVTYAKEQGSRETEEEKKDADQESIHENWEIVIKGSTPQEIIDQLQESENSSEKIYKITRLNKAINLQDYNESERIIQLESSTATFADFGGNNARPEFDLLESSFFKIKAALEASMDASLFEQIRVEQQNQAQHRKFNWDLIFQQSQGIQQNNNNENMQELQNIEHQMYNLQINEQQQQQNEFVVQDKYKEFLRVNVPVISPISYNKQKQDNESPSPPHPPNGDAQLVTEANRISVESFVPLSHQYELQLKRQQEQYQQGYQQNYNNQTYQYNQQEEERELEPMLN